MSTPTAARLRIDHLHSLQPASGEERDGPLADPCGGISPRPPHPTARVWSDDRDPGLRVWAPHSHLRRERPIGAAPTARSSRLPSPVHVDCTVLVRLCLNAQTARRFTASAGAAAPV
jgi:hypothetical protein